MAVYQRGTAAGRISGGRGVFRKKDFLFSVVLAVLFYACLSYMYFDNLSLFTADKYRMALMLLCIAGSSVIICLALRLFFEWLAGDRAAKKVTVSEKRKIRRLCFCVLIIGWLPWVFLNYPGSLCADSMWQIEQYFGVSEWTSQHPPLSTFLMGSFLKLGMWIYNANLGVFLYCLFQILTGAAVFSWGISFLYEMGLRRRYCLWILVFFVTPLWGLFAQWFEKDMLYTEMAVWNMLLLIRVFHEKKCSRAEATGIFVSGLLTAFLRNEGIYIVMASMICLAVYLAKQRREILSLAGAVLLIFLCVTNVTYPILGIQKGLASEVLGIPFQQTARYVRNYPDEVTPEEKESIDKVLDYEALADIYDPKLADPVKWSYRQQEQYLGEYLKCWFQMFLKRPGVYLAAAVNNNYAYLAPVDVNTGQDPIVSNVFSDYESRVVYSPYGIGLMILEKIRDFMRNTPVIRLIYMPGTYTWLIVVLCYSFIRKKNYPALLIFVPAVMNILVCLASPMSNSIRYELPTAAGAPFLLGYTIIAGRSAGRKAK